MKDEVTKIFNDLDAWRDHCRFNGLVFNEADLYKSNEWKKFADSKSNQYNNQNTGQNNRRGVRNKENTHLEKRSYRNKTTHQDSVQPGISPNLKNNQRSQVENTQPENPNFKKNKFAK